MLECVVLEAIAKPLYPEKRTKKVRQKRELKSG